MQRQISFLLRFHAVSRTQQGRQRGPSVQIAALAEFNVALCQHHQIKEMKILNNFISLRGDQTHNLLRLQSHTLRHDLK